MLLIRPRRRGRLEQHGRRPVLTGRGPEAASSLQEPCGSGSSFRMKQVDARASIYVAAVQRPSLSFHSVSKGSSQTNMCPRPCGPRPFISLVPMGGNASIGKNIIWRSSVPDDRHEKAISGMALGVASRAGKGNCDGGQIKPMGEPAEIVTAGQVPRGVGVLRALRRRPGNSNSRGPVNCRYLFRPTSPSPRTIIGGCGSPSSPSMLAGDGPSR